ncbi:diacylglycerol kinase family lipid kinase [Paenibacillus anaericanus]|uniref:Diacylglycerol kinase family lipid kinase n=1 Tax=Paenibacillus anaericanus TaxID=170367 RepID=A0A433XZA9_9BACL|nr:diacylglycerol kinase family protein [Paenibacillus anaericanus]RUT40522.1 diacylglycerol kinase family lipid kinase [Paenibacillus anaericanus]
MYLFVVNKNSGNGRGFRVWTKISKILDKRNILYQHIFTESADQAHTLLMEKLSAPITWKAVGVVGGDGTINSLLPALRDSGVPLAVFPSGSGNDTARGFHIPMKTSAALEVMLGGLPKAADLISISGQSALTALAVGFDAEVAHNVNNSLYKKFCNAFGLGRMAYVIGVFHTLITFRPAPLTVECDGVTHTYSSAWLTAVNNVISYGGGLAICPQAITDDGFLDICIVHDCSRIQLLMLFPTLLYGGHTRLPFVTMLRGKNISVHSSLPRMALGDGEHLTSTPLTAAADPGVMQVMCPHPG